MQTRNNAMRLVVLRDLEAINQFESTLEDGATCLRSDEHDILDSIKGGCSVGMFNGEELIAYSLAKWNDYGIGYVDKCFVAPAYRGQGIQKGMLSENLLALVGKKVHEVWAMASPSNIASLRSFFYVGFQEYKDITCEGFPRKLLKYNV